MPSLSEPAQIQALREAADETRKLLCERLPMTVGPTADPKDAEWSAAAAGLLARGAAILAATASLAEEGRMADAQVSLRVLLEHATVFCWIAIDPKTNLGEWRRWDDWRRLKVHRNAAKFGVEVLSPEKVEAIGDPPAPRPVPVMAIAVDRYWSENSDGFRGEGILTFHGLYAAVYRRSSTLVHPTQEGMERHMRPTPKGVVVIVDEQPASPPAPVSLAVPMMALMLLVYERRFDWPDPEFVRALADSLIVED